MGQHIEEEREVILSMLSRGLWGRAWDNITKRPQNEWGEGFASHAYSLASQANLVSLSASDGRAVRDILGYFAVPEPSQESLF